MKVFILLMLSSICYVQSVNVILEVASSICSKTIRCDLSINSNLDVSKIVVYFYDFQNRYSTSFPIDKAAQGILSIKNLRKTKKFFIYVGGFKSHIAKATTNRIRKAFSTIRDSYLIIVDHSAYTHDLDGYKRSYERAVKYVSSIGKKVAEMLAALTNKGVSAIKFHCIGHSLGGQILGYVGENFKKNTGRKISRITALDPAGPCFDGKSKNEHIRSGVADYVEIYHCNAGVLGSDKSLGDVNFFANDGKYLTQCGKPSCILNLKKSWEASKCSHKTCVMMWTASMLHRSRFPAYKCENYKNFINGKCSHNAKTTAGFSNPGSATGTYYFSTNGYKFH